MGKIIGLNIMVENDSYMEVTGGFRLGGELYISGSKNSCLPIMAATLLATGTSHLENVPRLKDVSTLAKVLISLGAKVEWKSEHSLEIDTSNVASIEPEANLVRQMRASVLVMGPLLARLGRCRIALPGGCSLGKRPIDLHLEGLEKLGALIEENGEHVTLNLKKFRLEGTTIKLRFPSVGATENIMMAATLAEGTTVIENAAMEPEIVDLATFLNSMGATVVGAGEPSITIVGTKELHPTTHKVIPDRIEAGTFLIAAAMTGGKVTLRDVRPDHLTSVIERLMLTGCKLVTEAERITIEAPDILRPVDIRTLPYPGFPTDLQPPFMTLMTKASGDSLFVEKIFERRFLVADELNRMGADIRVLENCALVHGGKKLKGCPVTAPDIRAAAALVIAGLWAEGVTQVRGLEHLYRGYEQFAEKLTTLGAIINKNTFTRKTIQEANEA